MLTGEWISAAKHVTEQMHMLRPNRQWKILFECMTDAGGQIAAQQLYQGNKMDKTLTSKTSANRHIQLAEWVITNQSRFARLRARAWKHILQEHIKDMEAAARGGIMHQFASGSV